MANKGGQLWKEYMRGSGYSAASSGQTQSSRKSSSVEPTVKSRGQEEWEKFKASGGLDSVFSTSVVDDFVRDSQAYMQQAGQRLQGMNWESARDPAQRQDWSRDAGSLQRRYHEARAFLRDNADRFDPENRAKLQSYLDQFDRDFIKVQEGYRGSREFYDQFADQAGYEDYLRRQQLWLNQDDLLQERRAAFEQRTPTDGLSQQQREGRIQDLTKQIDAIDAELARNERSSAYLGAAPVDGKALWEKRKGLADQLAKVMDEGGYRQTDILDRKIRDSVQDVAGKGLKQGYAANPMAHNDQKEMEAYREALQDMGYLAGKREELDYFQKYDGKTQKDTFFGQSGANYDMGRMNQDSALAWNAYLNDPTQDNRRKAETIDQLITQYAKDNEAALADDGTLPWISKTLANYLPQFFDQAKYSAAGGALGLMTGNPTAVKAGVAAGSGLYSYETMRGAAFKGLLEAGVDEQTARAAAQDEAVISSLIEMGDTALDLATLGGGKVIDLLTGGGKKVFEKAAQKGVLSKLASALGKYGLNVLGEGVQEGVQEAVSIANTSRDGSGKMNLVQGAAGVLWDAARNGEDPNRQQILEAGKEGMKIAAMMGAAEGGYNAFVSRYLGRRTQQEAPAENQLEEPVEDTEEQAPVEEPLQAAPEAAQEPVQEMAEQEVQEQTGAEGGPVDGPEKGASAKIQQELTEKGQEGVQEEPKGETPRTERSVPESGIQAQENAAEGGKSPAVQVSTGNPVAVRRIQATDGKGGMTYELEDGTLAQAKDIQMENAGEALLYEAVAEMGVSASAANTLVDTWKKAPEGVSPEAYTAGMLEAFNYGRYHIPAAEMEQSKAIQPLTDMQRSTAYAQGAAFGGELVQSKEANARRARVIQKAQAAAKQSGQALAASSRETAAGETGRKGRVVFDRKGRMLTNVQEAGIKTMELLSEVVGAEFHVFESYEKEGKRLYRDENGVERTAPNGWYEPNTGRIYVDLNAGDTGAGTMLFTVAHELTHFIRQWSPAKFDALAEAVIKLVYEEKGISVVKLVRSQQAKAERNGRTIDFDTAYEEVVADSMESILTSGRVAEMMAQIQQEDQTLWQKIRQWFQKLAQDIRQAAQAYAGYKPDSAEGRAVAQMEELLPILEGFYQDALQEAGENYRAAEGQKNTTEDGGMKFSFAGKTRDGIEVYETSDAVKSLPWKDRKKLFLRIMRTQFRGRTAKFIRNGHAYYAKFSYDDVNKNIYGDKNSDESGRDAKINIGADGNIFELVEHSEYLSSEVERGKEGKPHRGVKNWDYFVKTVQIDGTVFDLLANVRKKDDGEYVYEIELHENKEIEPSSPDEAPSGVLNGAPNGSIPDFSIDDSQENVNKKLSARQEKVDIEALRKELQTVSAEKLAAEKKYDHLMNDPELVAVERRMADIRNSAESRFTAIRSPEYKQARAEREKIRERLKLEDVKDLAYDLNERERKLQKELQAAEESIKAEHAKEVEEKAVAKSGLSEGDYFRQKAVKQFGITDDFTRAGYLLPDGKMLDFSGSDKKQERIREMDHREIQAIYEYTSQSNALMRFMNDGNIRIMAETPGIDISQKNPPTQQQYAEIKRFAREYADKRWFMVDITGENGQIIGTYTYDGKVNADRVVNDIKYYFQNGVLREQSAVASFLYSDRDPLQKKTLKELEKENAALREDMKQLKEWNKLQKQVTGGKMLTPRSVEAAARYLKKLFYAGGDAKELAQKLRGVYEYILNNPESTWEDVQEAAEPAIRWLQGNEKTRKSQYAQDILASLKGRNFRLDEVQLGEVRYQYGSLKEYRRVVKNMASSKAGMSLDELWQEMASQYPDIFDAEVNAADMPEAFAQVLERLENMEDSESAMEQSVKDQAMLREIYDSYWRVTVLETTADKHKKEMDAIRSQHEKKMRELRQKRDAALEELREEKKASVEGVRDTRNKADMRKKIRRKIMELQKLLLRVNKKQNVKEGMQDFAATALASAEILFMDNYSENDMIRNGVLVEVDSKESHLIEEAKRLFQKRDDLFNRHLMQKEYDRNPLSPEEEYLSRMKRVAALDRKIYDIKKQLKGVFERERNRLNKATVSGILGDLIKSYANLSWSDAAYIRDSFDENVYQHLIQLQKDVGGTTVRDMSLRQLKELADAYTMVLSTVRNANRLFNEKLNMSRDEAAGKVIREIRSSGKQHSKARLPGKQSAETFSWNNEKPVYAFERLGSETMMAQYQAIRDGQDTYAEDMQAAKAYRQEQEETYHRKDWDMDKLYAFQLESGNVQLNVEQMMSIYALSRRKEGLAHLLGGGFVFGKDAKRIITKAGVPMTYLVEDATAYRLTVEEINQIANALTKEQRAFADAMQKYLADVMGSKGNEVSMALYGVKSFNDEHYFPIRSSGQYMERAKLQAMQKSQGQINLVNSGFTKSTVPNAKNPVALDGFLDVWADHVQEMSMYHGLALPLEDFRRVYNYAPTVQEGQMAVSVNAVIENAYGRAATGYLDQLYKDLNADVVVDNRETIGKKMVGKFKAAAVMASASVVIQQFSALPRAFALIDPKYFIGRKLDKKKHDQLWAELKKYAPVAFIKEMGYFDTGVGMSGKQYLLQQEYGSIREKLAGLIQDENYRDEVLGKLPALADEMTWCNIWEAVKRETLERNPKMDVRSEPFLKLAGKRFSEIIDKTQVYDSVLSRSANMRSKAWYMNVITSFMAEPTTTINMVEDAIRKGDRKQIARTLGSVLLSQTMNALLVSMVYAARDDDEDKTWLEKYLSTVTVEMLEGFNPLGYYPLLKDVWSLMQGYDVERPDMTLVSEMVKAANRLTSAQEKLSKAETEEEQAAAQKALQNAMWGIADAVASLMGLPLKNIRRDVKGAVSLARTAWADVNQRDTTALSLQDEIWNDVMQSIPFFGSRYYKDRRDKLYGAMVADDREYTRRLEKTYVSESTFHGAVRTALREHDSRIWEAAVAWNEGKLGEYLKIAKEILGESHFEQDDIVLAIRAEAESMLEKKAPGEEKAIGIFNAEKLGVALAQDNGKMVKIICQDLIDTDMANGKREDEAKDALESDVRRELKQRYLEGDLNRNLAVRQLARHGGMTQEEASAKVEGWDWFKANPDSDATEADVTGYLKTLPDLGRSMKDYGLSMDTYRKEKKVIEAFESDKDEEGNSIAYSRIDKAFPYIHDLPLSAEQKTALAVACGWSLKTVEKNKLW